MRHISLFMLAITLIASGCVGGRCTAADREPSEAATIALAGTAGPEQRNAIERLGQRPPQNAAAVAKVLVDAVVGKDLSCQFAAGRALDSQLGPPEPNAALATALLPHAERLLTAAEVRMGELTNTPLNSLAKLTLPNGPLTTRLLALLKPGTKFRSTTITALGNSRPLTPEVKRGVLAEATTPGLSQQNLAAAMRAWPVADLAGEEVDRALVQLFDAVMGNVPPMVVEIAQRRAAPAPLLATHLQEVLVYPATSDSQFRHALNGYAACAGESATQAMIERLLAIDPAQDPARLMRVVAGLTSAKSLTQAMIARLSTLVNNPKESWWLRHTAARTLSGKPVSPEVAAAVAALAAEPEWVIGVRSASGWPNADADITRELAKTTDEEAKISWTFTRFLIQQMGADGGNAEVRRKGARQVAAAVRWSTEHPESAWRPVVVEAMLHGFITNYEPTAAERAQAIAYVTALVQRGFFTDAAAATMRFPEGGAGALAPSACEVLDWACKPERPRERKNPPSPVVDPLVAARLETARTLHAAKAPPMLLRYADRRLAEAIRFRVREEHLDPTVYRDGLTAAGFSIVPVQTLLDELSGRSTATKR